MSSCYCSTFSSNCLSFTRWGSCLDARPGDYRLISYNFSIWRLASLERFFSTGIMFSWGWISGSTARRPKTNEHVVVAWRYIGRETCHCMATFTTHVDMWHVTRESSTAHSGHQEVMHQQYIWNIRYKLPAILVTSKATGLLPVLLQTGCGTPRATDVP